MLKWSKIMSNPTQAGEFFAKSNPSLCPLFEFTSQAKPSQEPLFSWEPKGSVSVTVSLDPCDMLKNFCFHVYAQKSLFIRVGVKLCRFVGKPRLLLIQQRNFWDFVGKLQEKV